MGGNEREASVKVTLNTGGYLSALRETARLINVWADHGHEDTSQKALTQWATQTASLTPRAPRPSAR